MDRDRMRIERETWGYSQEALGIRLGGYSAKTIYMWEAGLAELPGWVAGLHSLGLDGGRRPVRKRLRHVERPLRVDTNASAGDVPVYNNNGRKIGSVLASAKAEHVKAKMGWGSWKRGLSGWVPK